MKVWPWSREPPPPVEQSTFRWAMELDDRSLRFSNGLEAPTSLIDQMIGGLSNARISRKDALKATAVLRARNLIAGVPATLPRELRERTTRKRDERNWLGVNPHPAMEDTVMFGMTFEDLFFEGTSYWRVTRWSEGFPIEAEHVDHRAVAQHAILGRPSQVVSEDHQFTIRDPIFIDGEMAPQGTIIRFLSPNPPFLVHAAKAIRTVLLLDAISADYATDPLPFGYFTDATDDQSFDDEEILDWLNKWQSARTKHRWGYIPADLTLNMLEWPSPSDLQLAEARMTASIEIARAAGLDPEEVGVQVPGSSRTYKNAVDRRLDLIDFTLMPYISAVQDRLSMGDITPRTLQAKFVVGAFARADFGARMESYAKGIEAEVLEVNEARYWEGWHDRVVPKPAPPPPMIPGVRPNAATVPANGNGNGREPAEVSNG
jgi:hypothetical protein